MSHPRSGEVMQIIEAAVRTALKMRHGEVRPEHLLLGLLSAGHGRTVDIIRNLGTSIGQLYVGTEQMLAARRSVPSRQMVPANSPATEVVLRDAESEAIRLKCPQVEAEHLLVALSRDPGQATSHLLGRYGLTLATIRHEIMKLYREPANS